MSFARRAAAAALGVALVAAVPTLAAQQALLIGAYGGQYTHFVNLRPNGPNADFRPGYNYGVTVGFQLSNVVSLHSDVTFARTRARGASPFAGALVDRIFLGEHLELALDRGAGLKLYAFGGGGMVQVRESPPQDDFQTFWKPAGMLGAGMFINVAHTNLDVMLEGKTLVYQFDRAGFNRVLWDASYGIGLAYRVALP
jgi:hypothetical protein